MWLTRWLRKPVTSLVAWACKRFMPAWLTFQVLLSCSVAEV